MTIIAVSGSSGLVGSALIPALRARGHEVRRLVRSGADAADAILWNPKTGAVDEARCDGVEAVVHLAGENIAAKRWTKSRREQLDESRGPATQKLCRALANLPAPPRTLLSASAVGFYGDRGAEELTEASASGPGFLADVARAWEAGTSPLAAAGARVVHLRIGVVLDRAGGALPRMLLPFRLGLGGALGSGKQYLSWITLPDLIAAITFLLEHNDARGAFNLVSPQPVDNRTFTRALGKALHRPALLPAPAFALRLVLGQMADELLLASQRVLPQRLQQLGFRFQHDQIDRALAAVIGAG